MSFLFPLPMISGIFRQASPFPKKMSPMKTLWNWLQSWSSVSRTKESCDVWSVR